MSSTDEMLAESIENYETVTLETMYIDTIVRKRATGGMVA